MTSYPARRSSPRLADYAYIGTQWYFVTINTSQRHPALVGSVAEECVQSLAESAGDAGFELLAYCVMPNHVHLLACGTREDARLVRFIQRFKQVTGYRYKQATGDALWHRSYHDHILRAEEDASDIAAYIWHNPVRAGLALDAASFAFSGPPDRLGTPQADRAEALSLRLGPLFAAAARES